MPDHTVSTGFLLSIGSVRAELKVMRIAHEIEDQPTREALAAILTEHADVIDAHPGRDMFHSLIERLIAEFDRDPKDTYAEDMEHLSQADFHGEDVRDMLSRTMLRHGLDEADVRSRIKEINDNRREMMGMIAVESQGL